MSTTLTARELAQRYADPAFDGPALGVEADVPLEGARLSALNKLFADDETLAGLEVFEPDGTSLGVVPLAEVLTYASEQPSSLVRGGRVGRLEGAHVSDAPLFRCDAHQPPYRRLLWAASPQLLKCKVCGNRLQRA